MTDFENYTESDSKIGNLTRRQRKFFVLERAALFKNKARVKIKNWLHSRLNAKTNFEFTSVYTVEIKKASPTTLIDRLKSLGRLIWTLPKRIYTTYLLVRFQELREPAFRNVCPMRYLNPFQYLHFNAKIFTKSTVMKAILRYARKDPNGLFWDRDNKEVFLPILRDLYPEETITEEDFILTCTQENLRKFRQPILWFVGPNSIDKRSRELEHVIDEVICFYTNEEREMKINGTKFSQALPVAIVSRLFLNYQGPMSVYQQIADSVDLINRCVMKRMHKQPRTKEEQEGYSRAVSTLRSAIDISYSTQEEGSFIASLKEQMTALQAKLSLYIMYFAGSDTTGGVLNYLLWQLGRHPEIQDEIYRDIHASNKDIFTFANESLAIHQVLSESLRLFSSAYVIGRTPIAPLNFTVKDKIGNAIYQERIGKNEKILSFTTLAGRDPHVFEHPDTFDPHRFTSRLKNYSWFPFGDGPHSCPGQWLAKAEISLFIAKIVQRYRIDSSPEKEFRQLGYITLKPSEEICLKLIRRERVSPDFGTNERSSSPKFR